MRERVLVAMPVGDGPLGGTRAGSSSIVDGRATRLIKGTPPGVLPRVCLRCVNGVVLMWRFAVGFLDSMMAGASVMRGIVRIGVSSITLCSSAYTLCSSDIVGIAGGIMGGGVRTSLMCDWSRVSRRRPFVVLPALLPSAANSSVSARKCWCGVNTGNWQCCGKSSVEPEMRYALVSGT